MTPWSHLSLFTVQHPSSQITKLLKALKLCDGSTLSPTEMKMEFTECPLIKSVNTRLNWEKAPVLIPAQACIGGYCPSFWFGFVLKWSNWIQVRLTIHNFNPILVGRVTNLLPLPHCQQGLLWFCRWVTGIGLTQFLILLEQRCWSKSSAKLCQLPNIIN